MPHFTVKSEQAILTDFLCSQHSVDKNTAQMYIRSGLQICSTGICSMCYYNY